ncbi:unnamed protein product [Symbiodinium sp. CCMP2456]|nr:unnamed protein product [Symbiodinium sp. CCMP2456]
MAWIDQQASLDLVLIQETHWKSTNDFFTGKWLALHSAGSTDPAAHSRYSGILVLLSKSKFQDPGIIELIPGRLVQIKAVLRDTKLPVAIYGVYQHVWRSQLTTTVNNSLRKATWALLDESLTKLPQRSEVIIGGDFNASLVPQTQVIGPAIITNTNSHDNELQEVLAKHALVVLNTWHCATPATYHGPTGESHIDFLVTRRRMSGSKAKWARPLPAFPVGSGRLAGHYPIHAVLHTRPFFDHKQPSSQQARINKVALQEAVRNNSAQAHAMREHVTSRLSEVPVHSLLQTQRVLNTILLQAAEAAFPAALPEDNRISTDPRFRVSASHTWRLYRLAKKPAVCTLQSIWAKWRLLSQFASASRQLRQQSKQLKQEFFHNLIDTAEMAAAKGDQRTLHNIVRRLTPKNQQKASRMQGASGQLLTSEAQLQAIVDYSNATFAAQPAEDPPTVLPSSLPVADNQVQRELSSLGISKAVLAGVLRDTLLQKLQPVLRTLPQFAYTKSRGTADALARAHGHFRQVALIYQSLRRHGVDEATIQVIQRLHFEDKRDLAWIQNILTMFADDSWGAWLVQNQQDFVKARRDLELILETLETLKMNINYQKTAVLLHLVGKDAATIQRKATYRKAGALYLKVVVHGRECGIPIKEEHESPCDAMQIPAPVAEPPTAQDAAFEGENVEMYGEEELDQELDANTRHKPCCSHEPRRGSDRNSPHSGQLQGTDPLRLMSRIILQQEGTGTDATPPATPLRTLLMQSMLQELQKRMQREIATEATKAALLQKGWIDKDGNWVYLRWDRSTKQLIQDPGRSPLQHSEAIRLLSWMMKELHGDIIQRFSSTPGLQKVETMVVPASTFHLEVALRGQTSLEMYEAFSTFSASAATHLIGVSIKKDNLHQSKLAKQLADITYPRRR